MQIPILFLSGAEEDVKLVKTNLVNCEIHLFKNGFVPGSGTTLAELVAEECDFDDYAPKVIAAWTGPILAPVGGWQINAPVQTWTVVTNAVQNTVGGYWIETAGGVLHDAIKFDAGVPMNVPGQAVQCVPVELVAVEG